MEMNVSNQQYIQTLEEFVSSGESFGVTIYPSFTNEKAIDMDYTNDINLTISEDGSCEISFNKRVIDVNRFTRFYSHREEAGYTSVSFEVDNGLMYELTNVDLAPV